MEGSWVTVKGAKVLDARILPNVEVSVGCRGGESSPSTSPRQALLIFEMALWKTRVKRSF